MTIHLVNNNNRTELNLDFTKFFSTDVQIIRDEKGVPYDKSKLEHKKMIKALVETFIDGIQFQKHPIDVLDGWFKEALEELENDKDGQEILLRNWMMFKEMYHIVDKMDSLINKMNKFTDKNHSVWRFKSGDCSFLSNGIFSITYEKTKGLSETDTDESVHKKLLDIYESTVENSDYILSASYKSLKLLSEGFDIDYKKHFIQIGNEVYDIKLIIPFLNSKETVEVWKNEKIILLRQSDRDTMLMCMRNCSNCEINRLEDVA